MLLKLIAPLLTLSISSLNIEPSNSGLFVNDVFVSKENTSLSHIKLDECNFISEASLSENNMNILITPLAFSCPEGFHYTVKPGDFESIINNNIICLQEDEHTFSYASKTINLSIWRKKFNEIRRDKLTYLNN